MLFRRILRRFAEHTGEDPGTPEALRPAVSLLSFFAETCRGSWHSRHVYRPGHLIPSMVLYLTPSGRPKTMHTRIQAKRLQRNRGRIVLRSAGSPKVSFRCDRISP